MPVPPEWTNLFLHPTFGRYGADLQPGVAGTKAPAVATAPFYSQFDYDASRQTSGTNTPSLTLASQLPTAATFTGATPYFSGFPRFQTNSGYDSSQVLPGFYDELTNHPANYNYFNPTSDRVLALFNMKQLLAVYGTANTEWGTSPLGQALPTNMADARLRTLITTLSADLDRPGVAPFVWDPADNPAAPATPTRYQLATTSPDPGQWFPTGQPIPYPALALRDGGGVPAGSEFNAPGAAQGNAGIDWRAVSATLGRLDLGRTFLPYPAPGANSLINTGDPNTLAQFTAAQNDRQQAAQQVFNRLRAATGALDPAAAFTQFGATSPEYRAVRWLAQLAVNVVDFIDSDSHITPFNWYTRPDGTLEWVYGTELPRLVVNEVYAELDNNPLDPGLQGGGTQATTYNVNVWLELHNPLGTDPLLTDSGTARLGIYQVLLTQPNTNLRAPENVLGDPDNAANQVYQTVSTFGPAPGQDRVLPASGQYSGTVGQNQGYFVLGASTAAGSFLTGANPNITSTFESPNMTYAVSASLVTIPNTTVLLRRLAHEYLPFNNDPTSPLYNPYVTVDYVENVPWRDGRLFDNKGARTPPAFNLRASRGRVQPYAAASSQWVDQNPLPARPATQVSHTFFRQNAQEDSLPIGAGATQTLKLPADWLVHLDRPIISPVELLAVSCYKPHELTQQFMTSAATFQHVTPWTQQNTRLYRFLEWVEAHDRSAGAVAGGRSMGKINLNTIWDGETLLALCDPQTSNNFSGAITVYNPANPYDAMTLFGQLVASRSPGLPGGQLGQTDRPFRGMAAGFTTADPQGQYPQGLGLADTLLRNPGGTPLFGVPGVAHPYLQNELLGKIFNSVTTRSNVFAVWCTVGFFEVTDDSTQPVKLGPEIGLADGLNVRNRFFCIVDRTGLSLDPANHRLQGPAPVYLTTTAALGAGANQTIPIPASGVSEGTAWSIQVGDTLVIDVGTGNEERVTVTSVAGGVVQANVGGKHQAGATVCTALPGNPGPQPQFDYRDPRYAPVVKYFTFLN
jgi:hypothetical protein